MKKILIVLTFLFTATQCTPPRTAAVNDSYLQSEIRDFKEAEQWFDSIHSISHFRVDSVHCNLVYLK